MLDFGLLLVRVTLGAFMAGHGAQKLFGWWKGPGLKGTHGFMEALGMRPGVVWGSAVAFGETSGGVLTLLGFLSPLGPLNVMSSMIVAIRRAHWKFPVWASSGGAELAATNLAAATMLATYGPGAYSLDSMLGIRLPKWFQWLLFANHAVITYLALQKPEAVQTAYSTVASTLPSTLRPTSTPDVAVETRPAPAQTQESSTMQSH
jgi:putative oxidoreductase